jgi:hypothetical protein
LQRLAFSQVNDLDKELGMVLEKAKQEQKNR